MWVLSRRVNIFSESTIKQIHVRLDRLEAKVDEKVDKQEVKVLEMKLDRKSNRTNSKTLEQRFDRIISRLDQIENHIRTLTWMTGIGLPTSESSL